VGPLCKKHAPAVPEEVVEVVEAPEAPAPTSTKKSSS